ncbi:MAG: hypothetical protein CR968_03670 [Flavobacteriia bacterium]|nr:MAG: hypothetical protein CR968_03670 [Flavobacteriia bacterium]
MHTKLLYLSDLKFNLDVWKRELKFHKNEIHEFEEKLEDIAARTPGKDVMAALEGYQNKIIREREVIGQLLQKIRKKRRIIESTDMNEEIDGRLRVEQHPLRDDMKIYIKLHYELKEELMDFLLRYL